MDLDKTLTLAEAIKLIGLELSDWYYWELADMPVTEEGAELSRRFWSMEI